MKEVLEDPENSSYKQYQEAFKGYNMDPILEIQPDQAQNVLKMSGETKSASRWIEEAYKEMKTPEDVTEERIAMIFVARQLGNAVYDRSANIKNARISEAQLRNHAQQLMLSPEFKEYYKSVENLDFKKTIKHGHGGYLEKTFEDFLVNSGAKGPLDFDVNGWYQRMLNEKNRDLSELYQYKNYVACALFQSHTVGFISCVQ